MKALIFGARGQVGSALIRLAPADAEVTGLDRHACDLGSRAAVEEAISTARPDVIINAAAYTAVDLAETEPEIANAVNAEAPGHMAAAARNVGARLVHISTDFVFDGSSSRPYTPADTPAPLGTYGRTKLAGEEAVRSVDPRAVIVRTAWVHASRGENFVTKMLKLMSEREVVSVVSDQVGTPTHADSLAAGLWSLALTEAAGIFHLTDSGVASWYDFAVAIAEEAQGAGLLQRPPVIMPIRTDQFPTKAERPSFSVLDNRFTWQLLGGPTAHWRTNLRQSLREQSKAR